MNRRRFLTLTAAALCPLPGQAETVTEWTGRGLGSALSLRLVGAAPHQAQRCFDRTAAEIERIESLASLHRDSALTRLNRDGRLAWPAPELLSLLGLADQVHRATEGAFDPTVQPLWRAIADGTDRAAASALIGWTRVSLSAAEIRLGHGQNLTLNGIAQGWAADRIAALLGRMGFATALIDMGEIAALGAPSGSLGWPVTILSPQGTELAKLSLHGRSLATSSPKGTTIGTEESHILGPKGQAALWQTVSVSAPSAALADALSTAFCLMDRKGISRTLRAFPDARLEALA